MNIKLLNEQLRSLNIGVSVRQKGKRLTLRATLPPKPGSDRPPHQQEISLGVYANCDGLEYAKAEAMKLGSAIASATFSWDIYKPPKQDRISTKEWIQQYKADYFSRRGSNPKTETTWDKDYRLTFNKLPQDETLTLEACLKLIGKTDPRSRTRQRYVMALTSLCKFAGLKPNFRELSSYSPSELTPRDLPTDNLIEEVRSEIPDPEWQWVYGLLAVYGLRPHEVFLIDQEKLSKHDPELFVTGGKTGSRIVYPFPFQWWNEWNLFHINAPTCTARKNSDYGNKVSKKFRQYNIPFKPYDLRHRWAIRTLELNLDRTLAAQQMGHSREIHDRIYHHWISSRIHEEAFNRIKRIKGQ